MRLALLSLTLMLAACFQEPAGQARVDNADCAGVPVPALLGRVSDHGAMLSTPDEQRLAGRLARYEAASGHQTAVLTVSALEGRTIEGVSTCIGNRWRLGDAARDDGILILLAARERQVRIALGRGLSTADNDARATAAIAAMTPHFAQRNIATRLDSGIAVLEREFP